MDGHLSRRSLAISSLPRFAAEIAAKNRAPAEYLMTTREIGGTVGMTILDNGNTRDQNRGTITALNATSTVSFRTVRLLPAEPVVGVDNTICETDSTTPQLHPLKVVGAWVLWLPLLGMAGWAGVWTSNRMAGESWGAR